MTCSDQLLIVEITSLEDRDDQVKRSLLVEINHNLVAAGVVGGHWDDRIRRRAAVQPSAGGSQSASEAAVTLADAYVLTQRFLYRQARARDPI
jgi:hypothetical protein